MSIAKRLGLLKQGDLAVQTAGTLTGVSGSTDLIKVAIVRDGDDTESPISNIL